MHILTAEDKEKFGFKISGYGLSDKEYFYKVVKIFSAAYVIDEDHLTNREMEFLYCLHKALSAGYTDIINNDTISRFFKTFDTKNTVKLWLNRLIEKNWVEQEGKNISIIGDFNKLNKLGVVHFRIDLIKDNKKKNA